MTAAASPHSLGPLAPLAEFRQFIPVRLAPLANGKTTKLPLHSATLEVADAHDPTAWTDYDTALALATALGTASHCVGFVLTENDPFFCVDIDDCRQGDQWTPLVGSLTQQLAGTVAELSQSGRGVHLWGRRSTMPAHTMKNIERHIECYSSKRFIALGTMQAGTMVEDCLAIDDVVAAFFPPREAAVANAPGEGPRPEWVGPTDDAELLRRAMQSRSAGSMFGNKASFADLWTGDETALGRAFPPDASSTEPYDRSSADAALAQHFAFWTGCDVERIERLMRQSALVRDKWDDRADYLVGRTIMNACRMQRDVLQDKPSAVAPTASTATDFAVPADPLTALSQWIVTDEQVEKMENTRMIWRDLVALSHLAVWAAPGGGGKTAVAMLAAAELADEFTVLLFQEDAGPSDLKRMQAHAKRYGYRMLNSVLPETRSSPSDQVTTLRTLVSGAADLAGYVMFFDTLKKYADLMNKGGSREFFTLMRGLTQRGATVILLGHTNKHRGMDGKLVFEGVGDVRNDVDELLYLESTEKDPRGCVTVTVKGDKSRCALKPATFSIDVNTMEVRPLDRVVDVRALVEAKRQFVEDRETIAAVRRALGSGPMLITRLVETVMADAGIGRNSATRVIDRYVPQAPGDDEALWIESRSRANNARQIALR